jgi:hypothetical protein
MASFLRRIQRQRHDRFGLPLGDKLGVIFNDVPVDKKAPRGSRRGTHKRPWRNPNA